MIVHQADSLLSNINCFANDTVSFDEIEDEVDRQIYDKAYTAYHKDPATYTLDEVCRILEID